MMLHTLIRPNQKVNVGVCLIVSEKPQFLPVQT